ncbi:SH3 domain-containing kinase-binding protein 1 isoform X3 [Corythoichthys intestinalis]|uniref:SH3 domain-containing kinase-binding protein 1 isoform X3 n=1 Tax=Corythoichthys intestinalis TaxID=161448 RepID=UPI0025A6456A|nr:SH3 domain-containing kinase-binding protein 1 isoform X3 [Corythoichthys intestinalis]
MVTLTLHFLDLCVNNIKLVEAVVEFDYEAQQDDELSLSVGDVIVNIRRDDGGWWEGELGGRRGLFPDNFVREIKKEAKRDGGQAKADLANGRASPVSEAATRPAKKGDQIRKRRCKAAFSYVPQHEDELELKIGDIIEIVAEVEEGWWEGVLNGKSGMFPSNFTKEILLDADPDTPASQEEPLAARNSKNSPGSESDGGDARSETGSGEIQPKKVRGFGFGDIFKDQPIKLRPRSVDMESDGDKVADWKTANSAPTDNMKGDPDSRGKGRELCKVLFPYEAHNEDELTIKEGEIITIVTKDCADTGWWMGEIGGRQGVFPDNFVKLLENEKERPKKPPPPGAPVAKPPTAEKKSDVKKVPPERPEHLPQREQDRGLDLDLDAVVPTAEKLSHPTASRPRVTDRRPRSQIIISVPESKPQVTTKPSALLPASPPSPSALSGPAPELRQTSPVTAPSLEDLRKQLRELRGSVELLKTQHRQEMKQLAGTLDEEKKIRLSLQMEVEHIKKILSK